MKAVTLADAADLIGRPWRLGARGPDAFDCWGLVRELLQRQHGAPLPDWLSAPHRAEWRRTMLRGRALHGRWLAKPMHGCVLLDERRAHVGMLLGDSAACWVVHARQRVGVCSVRLEHWLRDFPDSEAWSWQA